MAEQQYIIVRQEKSMALAYILLIFLGQFGVHRFYLDRAGSGLAQLLLGLVGWATVWIFIGFIPLTVLWIWVFIDLFLTAGMVNQTNVKMRASAHG